MDKSVIDKVSTLVYELRKSAPGSSGKKDAWLEKIDTSLEFLERNRVRTPIRDVCHLLVPHLKTNDPALLEHAIHALSISGRALLYFQEFFDYCGANTDKMSSAQLSRFIYECGRHGLRCKHIMDDLLIAQSDTVAKRLLDNSTDLMRVYRGICRFSSDYTDFVNRTIDHIPITSPSDQLILLRIIRQAKDVKRLTSVISRLNPSLFSPIEKFNLIYLMKKNRELKNNFPTRIACNVVERCLTSLGDADIPTGVLVTDVSDALDAMASLKISSSSHIELWMNFLVSRVAEIKYSPICGLWQAITDSLGHLRYFHGPWMKIVDDMASNQFALKSFASFQLIFFTSSLGRLNFYSERVYEAIALVLSNDVRSCNDNDMLGTLLIPFERAAVRGDVFENLVNAVLTQAVHVVGKKHAGDRNTLRGSLIVAYCSMSLNEKLIGDERIWDLIEYVIKHASYKNLSMRDYKMLFRIEIVAEENGVRKRLIFPKWIQENENFRWHDALHAQHVRGMMKSMGSTGEVKFIGEGMGDIRTSDGRIIVVDDSGDHMLVWKNTKNDKCLELTQLNTNGATELLKRLLSKRGVKNAEVMQFNTAYNA